MSPIAHHSRASHLALRALLAATTLLAAAAALAGERLPSGLAGTWRGEFAVQDQVLPFNFRVEGKDSDAARLVLVNHTREEAFPLQRRGDGSYAVAFVQHDTELQFRLLADGRIAGRYHHLVESRRDGDLEFSASSGPDWRFVPAARGDGGAALAGTWRFTTIAANGNRRERVAEFRQDGNRLTAVLLSTTGDSRALEGNVVDGQLRLSGFTGPAPSLYHGQLDAQGRLVGTVYGTRGNQVFEAVRDPGAALPDPFTVTRANADVPVAFSFPDARGQAVSLDDPRFHGKVVAIQLLGTWCPNCADESAFLAPWYRANRGRGVEVVGLSFEQEDDPALAARTLPRYRQVFGIDYPLLFAGNTDKAAAARKLPWLSEVVAFPTLVLLDRKGRVRQVHTGFASPETGQPHQDFVQRFNASVDALLAEPVDEG